MPTEPKIAFIISAFNRPRALPCVLASLQIQTESAFEVLVTDNADPVSDDGLSHASICRRQDERFHYHSAGKSHCYESAKAGVPLTTAPWICFPSDDNYYVPMFAQIMLNVGESQNADLVICDMIYDPRAAGKYAVLEVSPRRGAIDKGGFLVRRTAYEKVGGWPKTDRWEDGDAAFIEALMAAGVKWVKAPGVLWVHN